MDARMSVLSATMAGVSDISISSETSYFAGCQHERIIELREMRANVVVALNEAQMAFGHVANDPKDHLAVADSDFARDSLQAIVYRYLAKTNDISKSGELDDAYDLWTYSANSLKTVRSKWAKMRFFATDLYSDKFPTTEEILEHRQRAPLTLAVDETLRQQQIQVENDRYAEKSRLEREMAEALRQGAELEAATTAARAERDGQNRSLGGLSYVRNGGLDIVKQVERDREQSVRDGGGFRLQQPPQERPTDTDHREPQTTELHHRFPPPPPPLPSCGASVGGDSGAQRQSAVGGGPRRQLPQQRTAAGASETLAVGHHSHPPPLLPPSSPLTRRQMGAHAARQGLAHQPSALSDGAIEAFLATSHADNFIRWREIGYKNLEKARPITPHTSLTPTDYIVLKRRFMEAANNKGISEMDMLLELPHWFSGPVADVIMTATIGVTAETAAFELEQCFARMDTIFQGNSSMVDALLDGIASAPPIAENDYKAHFLLYAELLKAEKVATVCGQGEECHRRNRICLILNNRLPHLAVQFWKEDLKSERNGRGNSGYHELVELVARWATIMRQAAPDEHSVAYDQQRPDGQCGVCGHFHTASQCPILLDVSVDSRVDILSKRELCYHCFQKGHTAKYCGNKPTCQTCGRAHATILHDRNFNQ